MHFSPKTSDVPHRQYSHIPFSALVQCGKCPQPSDAVVIATCVAGFYTENVNFVPFAHW
jgi:hypothetical protein